MEHKGDHSQVSVAEIKNPRNSIPLFSCNSSWQSV